MTLNIIAFSWDMAEPVKDFVLPQVWQMPGREEFWYLAALDENTELLGAAVVDPVKPEAELLSIAVSPACTRMGVATELLDSALELLAEAGIEGLRAVCIRPEKGWGAVSSLLEANGFVQDEPERYVYEASLDEVVTHPLLALKERSAAPVSVEELSPLEHRNLSAQLVEQGLSPSVLDECEPRWSYVYRSDGEVRAIFLLSPLEDGKLDVLWTWLSPKAAKSRALVELFALSFRKAAESCPKEAKVSFTCVSDASDKLFHHFFPGRRPVRTVRVYYSGTAELDEEELEWKIPPAEGEAE